MNQDLKPGPLMKLGGGVLLLVSSFLDWRDIGFSDSGLDTDWHGLQGIWILLIAIIVIALGLIEILSSGITLPSSVLGFTMNQIVMILGFSAFLITFGLQFAEQTAVGVLLGWIAAAVIVAGSLVERAQGASSSGGGAQSF